MNFNVFVNQASIRDRRLIADFSFVSRPLLEVGVNSEGACNRVNTVGETEAPTLLHDSPVICTEIGCKLHTHRNRLGITDGGHYLGINLFVFLQ